MTGRSPGPRRPVPTAMDPLTLGVAAGTLALVAVAVLSVALLRTQSTPSPSTPAGAVAAFVQAIHNRQPDRALALVAPEALPGDPARQRFREAVLNGPSRPASVQVLETVLDGHVARVQIEVTTTSGDLFDSGSNSRREIELRRGSDGWLIMSDPDPWQFE